MMNLLRSGFLLSILMSAVAAQGILWSVQGTVPNAMLGYSVGWAPDQNGDGLREILAGAPEAPGSYPIPNLQSSPLPLHTGDGFVQILSGASGGLLATLTGSSPAPFGGTGIGSSFGWSLLTPGDLDGDGIDDLLVGAPTTLAQGWVEVFSGATLAPLYAPLALTTLAITPSCFGTGPSDATFGHSLAAMGDMDGDGVTDFVVGAPTGLNASFTQARTTVFSGATGMPFLQVCIPFSTPLDFGWSLVGGFDINGDGVNDFITSALNLFRVRSYSGVDGAMLSQMPVLDSFYGQSMARLPDQNGDGIDDIAVGAPGSSMGAPSAGRVVIQSGVDLSILRDLVGHDIGGGFGLALAGSGDFDGDGVNDLVVGTGANVAQVGFFGYVEVYSGASLHRLARITSPVAFNGFGWSLAFVGDLNGDGRDELAIGAPFEPNGSMPYAGAVYLVSGLTTPACATGGVGLPAAGPEAVLTLNGSPGPGSHRVPVGVGQPFSIEMAQPSTIGTPAKFTIFGAVGLPSATTVFPTLFGNFCLTPQPAAPSNPLLFHLVDSLGFGNPLITTSPAPWAIGVPSGLPFPGFITFQGVVEHLPGAPPSNLAITNAVILDVQ